MSLDVRRNGRARQGVRGLLAAVVASLAPAACGPAAEARPDRATTIEVTLEAGPHAGTHTAATRERVCVSDVVGAGTWGVQYARPAAEWGLSSFQLVRESERAWYLGVLLGPIGGGADAHVEVETRPSAARRGSGTVALERTPGMVVLRALAITADGIPLAATVRCPVDTTGMETEERR